MFHHLAPPSVQGRGSYAVAPSFFCACVRSFHTILPYRWTWLLVPPFFAVFFSSISCPAVLAAAYTCVKAPLVVWLSLGSVGYTVCHIRFEFLLLLRCACIASSDSNEQNPNCPPALHHSLTQILRGHLCSASYSGPPRRLSALTGAQRARVQQAPTMWPGVRSCFPLLAGRAAEPCMRRCRFAPLLPQRRRFQAAAEA
eukprot:6212898-Pleurochrysis_carterae.AAC.2